MGENLPQFIEIEIRNWEKHQPASAKRLKRPSWFAVSNHLLFDHEIQTLSAEELKCWLALLCEASNQNKPTFKISLEYFSRRFNVCSVTLHRTILKAIDFKWLNLPVLNPCLIRARDKKEKEKESEKEKEKLTCTEVEKSYFSAEGGFDPSFNYIAQELKLSKRQWESWLAAYENKEWIVQEIKKAFAWIEANPKKRPRKSFARFITNWLSRGWETHRKTLPSNAASHIDWNKIGQ